MVWLPWLMPLKREKALRQNTNNPVIIKKICLGNCCSEINLIWRIWELFFMSTFRKINKVKALKAGQFLSLNDPGIKIFQVKK